MRVFIYFGTVLFLLVMSIVGHGVYVYAVKHKIDKRYTVSYSQEGYRLIDTNQKAESVPSHNSSMVWRLIVNNLMPLGREIIGAPIVWYCVTKDYIIGCVGEDITDKPESYIPDCQKNGYFIVNKADGNVSKNLQYKAINRFINTHNLTCRKIAVY